MISQHPGSIFKNIIFCVWWNEGNSVDRAEDRPSWGKTHQNFNRPRNGARASVFNQCRNWIENRSQQRKPNHDSKSVISLRKRQMRPIVHCGLIPSPRCAQLAQQDTDRQKKLQKVPDFEKAAYQHGMNPPKLLCLWQRQKQCQLPKWAYLRKVLLKKSFINNFVCFSSWKREQRRSAAPIYDIQTLRKLFCPAVAKPAPHLLISIPTTVYICLKFLTNGLSIYSHHIWS